MSEKSELYNQLKEAGVVFPKAYVSLTVAELEQLGAEHLAKTQSTEAAAIPDQLEGDLAQWAAENPLPEVKDTFQEEYLQGFPAAPAVAPAVKRQEPQAARSPQTLPELEEAVIQLFKAGRLQEDTFVKYRDTEIPVADRGADRAGLTFNWPDDVPIRIDTLARIWFMDEVGKPAIPRARMTRKTRSVDPGVKEVVTRTPEGFIDEIFEVAGDANKELTTTTTLPSWQVGRYKDVRFPFSIHVYNELRGFDYSEVVRFFGGRDFVPTSIKSTYVGNMLCFDISTTRVALDKQFEELKKGMK